MAATNSERLRIAHRASRDNAWEAMDLGAVAQDIAATLSLPGYCLPPTVVYRRVVVPVVAWDLNALAGRLRSGLPPILERSALRGLEVGEDPAPCPVILEAFLCFSPYRRAKVDLAVLSIYARSVWVTPASEELGVLEQMECDVRGYTAVSASPSQVSVLVNGHTARRPEACPTPVQDRLYREQLFDVAFRSGLVPPL